MKESSYKNIFKSTAIFGGVQVFGILISIVRSKFIAVLLGPAGMGINALLTSSTTMISSLTNFGLGTSAVKNIAAANATGDELQIAKVVTVFRHWVWITGLLGFLVTLVLAPWLSEMAFGNRDYTISFLMISVTLLLTQISSGQGVVLRGMRQIKYMAQSGMIGSALGLVTSLPLYYFFAEKGIVPAIIITSITSTLLTWYYARKIQVKKVHVNRPELISEGKGMFTLGFMLSLSGLITTGVSYLVRIFISNKGGLNDVGLYNAGFAIINSYVGMVFTAMSADYYPRLSGVAHDKVKVTKEINQQAEIALLIIAPIICTFLVYIDWAVTLLYSRKFIAINAMIQWAALGMFFKATSWAIAFILLAKGASKVFFWNELITNVYLLVLNLAGYYYYGLAGLGISFMIAYLIYLVQIVILTRSLYDLRFRASLVGLFIIQFSLGLGCFLLMKFAGGLKAYIGGSLLIISSAAYSFYELNRRVGFKELLKKKK